MIVRAPWPSDPPVTRGAAAIIITQATHSWLSGCLARAWGGKEFSLDGPSQLFTAAELHDIGFVDWDRQPEWNAKTGLPTSFLEMNSDTHLRLWREGRERAASITRYAGFFLSQHATHLYRRFGAPHDAAERAKLADFQSESRVREAELLASLRECGALRDYLTRDWIDHQQKLIAAWDFLSLEICGAMTQNKVEAVPSREGVCELNISREADGSFLLDPWPFSEPQVDLRWDARIVPQKFVHQKEQDDAMPLLETVMLETSLRRG